MCDACDDAGCLKCLASAQLDRLAGEQGLTGDEQELARVRRELAEARAAVGEGWFAGGASLAEAVRRKNAALEALTESMTRRAISAAEGIALPASYILSDWREGYVHGRADAAKDVRKALEAGRSS
jgi:hypothetical protein